MINRILATPKVRKFARELGADISNLRGSERNGRITEDDVKNFIKGSKNNTQVKEIQKILKRVGKGMYLYPPFYPVYRRDFRYDDW